MSSNSDDAQRVQEIRARLQDRWYSAEQTREDVRYLLARLEALDAERDEWKAKAEQQAQLKADFRAAYQAAQMAGYDMEALRDRAEAERDALAGRLATAEAALIEWARLVRQKDELANRNLDAVIPAGEGARHFREYNAASRVLLDLADAALAGSREQATGEWE